jgi:hypothetical protein
MTSNEIFQIGAVLLSPVIAIQVEKFIERRRQDKQRKIDIFKTLMASRGSILSFEHVAALNRIDLEFTNDNKYKKVIDAWKEYFDHLNIKFETDEQFAVWNAQSIELLSNLLFEMGNSLKYNFNKSLIKRNVYAPKGHVKIDNENNEIRRLLMEVLSGESPLLMQQDVTEESVAQNKEYITKQIELQGLMIDYYKKQTEQ